MLLLGHLLEYSWLLERCPSLAFGRTTVHLVVTIQNSRLSGTVPRNGPKERPALGNHSSLETQGRPRPLTTSPKPGSVTKCEKAEPKREPRPVRHIEKGNSLDNLLCTFPR